MLLVPLQDETGRLTDPSQRRGRIKYKTVRKKREQRTVRVATKGLPATTQSSLSPSSSVGLEASAGAMEPMKPLCHSGILAKSRN